MNNKGFTLIELIISIAIMLILSFAVITSLESAREKTRESKKNEPCEMYENVTIDRVPAKCLIYFGITTVNN